MKKYQDHYFRQAKQDNYPARSIYKLLEIDKRYKVFRPGQRVLDLGAAPGSWCLGAAQRVGSTGLVIGADIQATNTAFPKHVQFYQEDVFNRSATFENLLTTVGPFHVVMSDMAPKTTGHRGTDQARSAALYEEALQVALLHLRPGGTFIVKVFMGPDVTAFAQTLRQHFSTVKSLKPASSRSESFEIFYLGLNLKTTQQPSTQISSASSQHTDTDHNKKQSTP